MGQEGVSKTCFCIGSFHELPLFLKKNEHELHPNSLSKKTFIHDLLNNNYSTPPMYIVH